MPDDLTRWGLHRCEFRARLLALAIFAPGRGEAMRFFVGRNLAGCTMLIFGGLAAGIAAGQSATSSGTPEHRTTQPYTAEFKITSEQTLANGTTITRETREMDALDSQGRRLTVTTTAATETRPERSSYHVYDPVARTNSNWSVPGERATVTPMPPIPKPGQAGQTCWSATASSGSGASTIQTVAPRPEAPSGPYGVGSSTALPAPRVDTAKVEPPKEVHEDLGMQAFEGVQARGTRTTRSTPVGAIGNDEPLVRITETWRATSFGMIVHEVTDDPQTGKRTKEMTQFSNREPYAGSFMPPEGYEIVTQEMHEIPCGH